ncbi:MAG: hypothetical protein A2909_01420 [Candidatus Tagabacteria bacterium RIFCSPLOWO2_01_FULL_39_11]|uniref:tRNA dimethylallyltransferase n=1 Tax=Candidatus Tagabacteria bacterium RIFCSPLOWO2_01_FULL_39_11 TaxID=1802295 RepID=A0A1G2LQK0_9BACT|nr:MAG: hypothetical protein A2909_01420 [Candidatus Tagabacteria bacterium RIFCSPLOWO2_01_FULL_39_11]
MKKIVNPVQVIPNIEPRSFSKAPCSSAFSQKPCTSQSLSKDSMLAHSKLPDGANPQKIIVILGPNASGKSEMAVKIAKKFNGEIISADSRQVYKGLDIGTGKVEGVWKTVKTINSDKLRHGIVCQNLENQCKRIFIYKNIPHYCIDFVSPKKVYSAGEFKKCGQKAIDDIIKKGKLPIFCGGTGFYIEAALDMIKLPGIPADWKLRKKLEKKSSEQLFKMLQKLDPSRAKNIDPKNKRRLVRAIEITASPDTKCQNELFRHPMPELNALFLGITHDPEILKKRIERRLLARIKQGMIKEVENLHKKWLSWKRLDDLGLEYRWISLYLKKINKIKKAYKMRGRNFSMQSKSTYDEMIAKLNVEIRRYAKRQMTWFGGLNSRLKKENNRIYWIKNQKDAEKLIITFISYR